jgi:Sec-independent protein translocase protein TatA
MKELKKALQEVENKIKKEGNLKSLQDEKLRLEKEIEEKNQQLMIGLSEALNNIFK